MKTLLTTATFMALVLAARADELDMPPEKAPAPLPEKTTARREAAAPARTPVEIILVPGQASATPYRKGVAYANGGAIEVRQPDPTTIVVTMSGLCATNADLVCKSIADYDFELVQDFEICIHSDKVVNPKLVMEGQVMGILRSDHSHYTCPVFHIGGLAQTKPALAALSCGDVNLVSLELPARSTSHRVDLSVYNHDGPFCGPALPGKYTLRQTWGFGTVHPPFFCRGASAEFSPQPQYFLEPYWFQNIKPFNGIATNDFGFKVTLKVVTD